MYMNNIGVIRVISYVYTYAEDEEYIMCIAMMMYVAYMIC